MRRRVWAPLVSFLLLAAAPAPASEYFVAPGGSDSAPGTFAAPFASVKHGIEQLSPGDILTLRGGTYFERIKVSKGGSAGNPIIIQGYPGETAVLDSGYPELRSPNNDDWELVDASLGEYRTKRSCTTTPSRAYVLGLPGYENERVMLVPYKSAAAFRSKSDSYNASAFYVGPGTFVDSGRCHIRLAKTKELLEYESRYGKLFDDALPDPRKHAIILSQESATLELEAQYITLRGFTINQATHALRLGTGAANLRIENMTIWSGDSAIDTKAAGIHDVVITGSRVYGDHPPWIFWSDMKDAPTPADLARGTSIALGDGARDWELSYNHIRGSGQDLIGVNDDETGVRVHHNRLENCGDDAFELEGTTDIGHIEIYENYISNCLVGVAPGQDSAAMTGPLLVYRNVFAMLRDAPVNREPGINTWNGGGRFGYEYLFKHGTSSGYSTKNTHYYHNTLVMLNAHRGLNITPKSPDGSTVANNIMIVVNSEVHGSYRQGSGQLIDGDLYWKPNSISTAPLADGYDTVSALSAALGIEKSGLGSVPKQGTDPKFAKSPFGFVDQTSPVWTLSAASERRKPSDFLLAATSPGCTASVDLKNRSTPGGSKLPDSRNFAVGVGAYPCGTDPKSVDVWPLDPSGNAAGSAGAGGSGASSGSGGTAGAGGGSGSGAAGAAGSSGAPAMGGAGGRVFG